MKKIILPIVVLITSLILLAACANNDVDEIADGDTPDVAISNATGDSAIGGNVGSGVGGEVVSEHPIVGSWEWELDSGQVYIFDADGTGTRGDTLGIDYFTWAARHDGGLRLRFTSGPLFDSTASNTQDFDTSIYGDILTIIGSDMRHFIRVGSGASVPEGWAADAQTNITPNVQTSETNGGQTNDLRDMAFNYSAATAALLHGQWQWELDWGYVYTFNADGTGTRGGILYGFDDFYWSVPMNGVLRIIFTHGPMFDNPLFPQLQDFAYSIHGDVLTIIGDDTWHYIRVDGTADATAVVPDVADELVGSWEWELAETYVYTFNADGTGTRGGILFGIDHFNWSIPANGVLRMEFTRGPMFDGPYANLQDFGFSINGNILTIVGGDVWHYIRR